MNLHEQVDLIAHIPLFSSLPALELERLAGTLRRCEFPPGAVMIREGERDEHFFILLDGEVEVIKALNTPDERLLGIYPGGTMFGEMSIFNPEGTHTASVLSRLNVQALEMTRQDFDLLLRRNPHLAYETVRILSKRLEESENATIIDLREKNYQLAKAYEELKAAQAQLIIKEKLEKELDIAREIQESILPDTLPHLDGFDVAALSFPARAVGGDYYDFIPLGKDRFGLVVGDACDKGIPAALFINLTNSLVHIEAQRNPSPEAALRLVNGHLIEVNRSGMFVSLLYGILNSRGQFDYSRAGHPHPMILDANHQLVPKGSGAGMPLGILDEIQLDSRTETIEPGGLLVIYSDGLSEALSEYGEEFGSKRLAEELAALNRLPADQICSGLWSAVQKFNGSQPQTDDFTVIVIKRTK
jgi:sigma-B regulation protein RsbU (phosphoserine phosphatase)